MSRVRYRLALFVVAVVLPLAAAADLQISGVEPEIERNIRAFAALAGESCEAENWLVRRRFRALEQEARKALEPFGFYTPDITSALTIGDPCWQATLVINPGEPVRYRDIDVAVVGAAAQDPAFADLAEPQFLAPGGILRHADYERLKKTFQVRAADRGYVEANFVTNSLEVWPELGAADIALRFDSGPRYRIGEIIVEQDFLDQQVVAGYLDLETGAPFHSADLAAAHRDLADSAYFADVTVRADVDKAANDAIPVRISLSPGTRIEYTVGAGASTDTGARFRAGFRNNRFNSRGHRIIADLAASEILQGLSGEYRIPLGDPRREWFSVTGALSNEETDSFDNEAQRLGIRWTRAMSDTWLRTLSLDASNESYAVADDIDTSRFIVPGITFDQKIADRDVFPTRGRRLGAELRGTDEAIGSTTSYFQLTIWARWIRSFGDRNRILARMQGGATASQDFSRLPPSVRFFAGGDESVRGYEYNSLGPSDDQGDVVGGTNLLVASIEYERHIAGNFYGAMFVDAGNAFDDSDFDPEVGAGFGLKWRSPLGPVRMYLGYPVTADEKSVRVHLRLGADL